MNYFLAILVSIIAAPPIALDWLGADNQEFKFSFRKADKPCIEELNDKEEIKYRFLVEGCQPGVILGPRCGSTIVEVHKVRFDPITESYKVTTDRHDDDFEPRSVTFNTAEEAVEFASKIESITSETVRARSQRVRFKDNPDVFLRARVIAECKSSFERKVSWLPYLLTFGIIERSNYDSGWYNFNLK